MQFYWSSLAPVKHLIIFNILMTSCPSAHCRTPPHPPHPTSSAGLLPIPPTPQGLDVGPESSEMIKKALSDCKTILWNGPMGGALGAC